MRPSTQSWAKSWGCQRAAHLGWTRSILENTRVPHIDENFMKMSNIRILHLTFQSSHLTCRDLSDSWLGNSLRLALEGILTSLSSKCETHEFLNVLPLLNYHCLSSSYALEGEAPGYCTSTRHPHLSLVPKFHANVIWTHFPSVCTSCPLLRFD